MLKTDEIAFKVSLMLYHLFNFKVQGYDKIKHLKKNETERKLIQTYIKIVFEKYLEVHVIKLVLKKKENIFSI